MTQISPNFTLAELTQTNQKFDNTCPPQLMPNLLATAAMLEAIREHLGRIKGAPVPVHVNSAYRSPAVNRAVGGGISSDHMLATAADFKAPGFGTPYEVCKALAPHIEALGIGQIIHEFGRWVHVSTRTPAKVANRVITISDAGAELGIQVV